MHNLKKFFFFFWYLCLCVGGRERERELCVTPLLVFRVLTSVCAKARGECHMPFSATTALLFYGRVSLNLDLNIFFWPESPNEPLFLSTPVLTAVLQKYVGPHLAYCMGAGIWTSSQLCNNALNSPAWFWMYIHYTFTNIYSNYKYMFIITSK